ncbi:MAG TPA: saccharopine dehydrogenase NADP-binding domain-containing protein [Thermoanaerobaculia bacterium]|nr:saccharopine dehydrogenase NADP-binding domain-containing protein [Thermoanaerobaculia bacterium]
MWLLYGANGYTGELIAREAVRRGDRPILAGRDAAKIEPLARELGCEWRAFDLTRPDLSGVQLVLHCAGPFLHTSAPMVNACLAAGVHYLDITGEIVVFESVFRRHDDAVARGVALIPGVGFDVVPTDCLAAMLHKRMPDATELWLAFSSKSGVSRGTLKTMLEGMPHGGAIRENGKIRRVPQMFDVREIPYASGPRISMTIPWGDISTAYRSTKIPNIRVYSSQSRGALKQLKRIKPLLPLLKFKPVQKIAQRWASKTAGPSAETRASARVELWGRARNANNDEVSLTMSVAEGYHFTMLSALAAVERVLQSELKGALTPSMAFGSEFVLFIEGTQA